VKSNQERLIGYREAERRAPPEVKTGVLWLVVPYTTPELTRAALRHAAVCSDLNIHVSLVDIQVVPFPCPLDQPPINKEYSARRLRELFSETGLPGGVAVVYTRDWLEGFRRTLEPKSLVILATRKRWRPWPTREEKLARALTRAGHQVMLLPFMGGCECKPAADRRRDGAQPQRLGAAINRMR
jgi:hypothetical protein